MPDVENVASQPVTPAEASPKGRRFGPRRGVWVWRPLAAFAASRVVTFVAALVAATLASGVADDLSTGRPWPRLPPTNWLTLRALGSWDGGWYIRLARYGYPDPATALGKPQPDFAFFPLFPMLIRAVSDVTGLSLTLSAVLISTLFGAAATVGIWVLARKLGGTDMADRAVVLFCFFPAAIVLSMAYSESMMITFAVVCLIALLDRRWWLAGVAAALATATRPNAAALCLCCAWAAAAAIHRRRDWWSLVAPALSATGIAAYFVFLWVRTGNFFFWFKVEREKWGQEIDLGAGTWRRLANAFSHPLDLHRARDMNSLLAAVAVIFMVVAMYFLWRWRPPAILTIYALTVIFLAVSSQALGVPRFAFTAFPLLLAVAAKVRGMAFQVVVTLSAGLLGIFMILSVATRLAIP